ncbi:MAG: hypothetical protein IJ167_12385, partial [Lachnospiraceae bacterium]|nr:hypothetical protein [Lachnospiraceae bacterium]
MRLIICDNIREDALFTKKLIEEYLTEDKNNISIISPDELLGKIDDNEFDYDIAVIEIEYHRNDLNGIELGKRINDNAPLCNIIYLTDLSDFVSDVYETRHCYFVMKKNQQKTLNRALDKALELYYENSNKNTLHIKCNYNDVY